MDFIALKGSFKATWRSIGHFDAIRPHGATFQITFGSMEVVYINSATVPQYDKHAAWQGTPHSANTAPEITEQLGHTPCWRRGTP